MPTLEKLEIQENECLFHAEITDEQKQLFLEWEEAGGDLEDCPDWVWELDWDLDNDRPGYISDNLISIELED